MSANEFSIPDMDRSTVDKSFSDITRPHGGMPELDEDFMALTQDRLTFQHYLENSAALVTAMDTQQALSVETWPTEHDLSEAMDRIVADLNVRARADQLLGEQVTISGATVVLPHAVKDEINGSGVRIHPRIIEPGEFVPQLILGETGRFHSFYYRIIEHPDDSFSTKLVYRIAIGKSNTPNQETLIFVSADVDYTTRLEFDKDDRYRDLRDAGDVFEEVKNLEVSGLIAKLHTLMATNSGEYTAEELNTISSIVQKLSTHDALKEVRQKTLESLETMIIAYMSPRLGGKPLGVAYTAGLLHSAGSSSTPQPLPHWQQSDDLPFRLEPTMITEVAVRPIYDDTSSAQEPYMIIRLGRDTHYVPLSKITAIV